MRLPALLSILLPIACAACAAPGQIAASDRSLCLSQGYAENSDAYARCRRDLEAERAADLASLRAAAADAEPDALDILNREATRRP